MLCQSQPARNWIKFICKNFFKFALITYLLKRFLIINVSVYLFEQSLQLNTLQLHVYFGGYI